MNTILVYGKNQYGHDKRLEVFIKKLEEAGITLNRSELFFFSKHEETFLGHKVSDKGIAPDPEKVKAITKMEAQTNRKELKSFFKDGKLPQQVQPKVN